MDEISRMKGTEEKNSELGGGTMETTQVYIIGRKQLEKNEQYTRDLWDSSKSSHIVLPEFQKKKDDPEKELKVIMTENFPNVAEDTNVQIQETKPNPNRVNPDESAPRHTFVQSQISES